MTCAVIIPAYNESATIAQVIKAALTADIGEVWVVDDGSSDSTAKVAQQAGSKVIRLKKNKGKGGAIVAGANHLEADILLLLDADLIGLKPNHIYDLAKPLLNGSTDMVRGDFKGGRWQTNFSQAIAPVLNGQRAILRQRLLSIPKLAQTRYGVEVAIALTARRERWQVAHVSLQGVSQIMKEEKVNNFIKGFGVRLKMYGEIIHTLARFSFMLMRIG